MGNIYTIPASMPFAETLAKGLLKRTNYDAAALSRYHIILPTNRACRTLREAFLKHSDGHILLLPKLSAIGHPDEDELQILSGISGNDATAIPPAISQTARLGLLSKLIHRNRDDITYEQALFLAQSLMRLIDELHMEGLGLDSLESAVPEEFADHWQITLDFLTMLRQDWPDILKARGVIEPFERRNLVITQQAKLWTETPPQTPIIAAGITGSVPATIRLLKTVLKLDEGEIILPGFDTHMIDDAWDNIEPTHPQFAMYKTIQNLGVARHKVSPWQNNQTHDQDALLSLLNLPASHIQQWENADIDKDGFAHMARIDCESLNEEASVISVIVREALEQPQKTIAIITPDRTLSRHIAQKLSRWGIEVDDSAGTPLTRSNKALFVIQLLNVFDCDFAPVALLSLLKNSLMGDHLVPDMRRYVRQLDNALRGIRPKGGLAGIERKLSEKNTDLLNTLDPILSALDSFAVKDKNTLETWVKMHIGLAEALATTQTQKGADRLWQGEDGEALAQCFYTLMDNAHDFGQLSFQDYMIIVQHILQTQTIRPKYGLHPRIQILGLLESRLYNADVKILAGLNDGVWPASATHDPWLPRPLRNALGIPTPDEKIGYAAHDFMQMIGYGDVYLTRSKKVDGAPTIASPWLYKLEAFLAYKNIEMGKTRPYKRYAKALLDTENRNQQPIERPAPTPPNDARPSEMSVTNIERWMVDPYSIYAKYILRLRKLDELEKEEDAAMKGSIIHDIMHDFFAQHKNSFPDNYKDQFLEIADKVFKEYEIYTPQNLPWWPRLLRVFDFVAETENTRPGTSIIGLEAEGAIPLDTNTPFKIFARADRIDQGEEGLEIIDYKTGGTFSQTNLENGYSPQLPLTGLIAQRGGFQNMPPQTVQHIIYYILKGAQKDAGHILSFKDTETLIRSAEEGVKTLVTAFADSNTPYLSLPIEHKMPREAYQDYRHLARVQEWANEDGEAA